MSFVYSIDLINLLEKFLQIEITNDIIYQSYNLSFDQAITQEMLLEHIKNSLPSEIKPNGFEDNTLISAPSFYPSVDCGPISNEKARDRLFWNPSRISDAIHETVQFFLKANGKYKEEESEAVKKLEKKLKK